MENLTGLVVLSVLVLVFVALRALQSVRHDRHTGRGSEPGRGYHQIDATYHSGGGGGGHSSTYRVPRDPQEYARLFIPKDRKR